MADGAGEYPILPQPHPNCQKDYAKLLFYLESLLSKL
jgi:hypothetical protein